MFSFKLYYLKFQNTSFNVIITSTTAKLKYPTVQYQTNFPRNFTKKTPKRAWHMSATRASALPAREIIFFHQLMQFHNHALLPTSTPPLKIFTLLPPLCRKKENSQPHAALGKNHRETKYLPLSRGPPKINAASPRRPLIAHFFVVVNSRDTRARADVSSYIRFRRMSYIMHSVCVTLGECSTRACRERERKMKRRRVAMQKCR